MFHRTLLMRFALLVLATHTWPCQANAALAMSARFDCEAGYTNWRYGWSSAKQTWCCANADKGCPFDCKAAYHNRVVAWSVQKMAWCCAQKQIGCAAGTSAAYDCDAGYWNWKKGWSVNKIEWCCKNKGLACPPTTTNSTPWDCGAGYRNWRSAWSSSKKHFCCQLLGMECISTTATVTTTSLTSTARSTRTPTTTNFPFECDWWRKGLAPRSEDERDWCCTQRSIGCSTTTSRAVPRSWGSHIQVVPQNASSGPLIAFLVLAIVLMVYLTYSKCSPAVARAPRLPVGLSSTSLIEDGKGLIEEMSGTPRKENAREEEEQHNRQKHSTLLFLHSEEPPPSTESTMEEVQCATLVNVDAGLNSSADPVEDVCWVLVPRDGWAAVLGAVDSSPPFSHLFQMAGFVSGTQAMRQLQDAGVDFLPTEPVVCNLRGFDHGIPNQDYHASALGWLNDVGCNVLVWNGEGFDNGSFTSLVRPFLAQERVDGRPRRALAFKRASTLAEDVALESWGGPHAQECIGLVVVDDAAMLGTALNLHQLGFTGVGALCDGWLSIRSTRCQHVLAIGGGADTALEMEACKQLFENGQGDTPPSWTVLNVVREHGAVDADRRSTRRHPTSKSSPGQWDASVVEACHGVVGEIEALHADICKIAIDPKVPWAEFVHIPGSEQWQASAEPTAARSSQVESGQRSRTMAIEGADDAAVKTSPWCVCSSASKASQPTSTRPIP